jgi:TRAP-type C4-dicarboxylate transport system substrate-binding protein
MNKLSDERRARIKKLAKELADYFKNRTPEEIQEDNKRAKEISDAWSVVDGDGLSDIDES